ncbi:MAG TPA: sulfurtransferase [Arenimonas sp.]|nr:sulfurtransferase [Arenimonas sp.]
MYLNIAAYHFHPVADPQQLADRLRDVAEQHGLLGTVLVAPEGINAFLVGAEPVVEAWLDVLRAQDGFSDVAVKRSRSQSAPFARLKVKCKPEIITFRREQTSPLQGRAPEVSPRDLARWIAQGCDDAGRPLRLLDTRNREEFAHGSFENALTLPIDKFTDLPDALEAHRADLQEAAVVGFCTGGIRCEKAVRWMQQAGFDHAYQLKGGILGYFEEVGGFGYSGRCFVFDERVALDAQLQPLVDTEVASRS